MRRPFLPVLLLLLSAVPRAQGVQESLADLRLATAVRLALAADPVTAVVDAHVSARAGAVVVDASWPSSEAEARAEALAGAVPGVATLAMGDGPAEPTQALGAGTATEPDEAAPSGVVEEVVPLEEAPTEPAVAPAPPARPAPAPPPAPVGAAAPATHTVRVGDTLYSIARRYGTTVAELQRLNGLGDSTEITLGSRLRVR